MFTQLSFAHQSTIQSISGLQLLAAQKMCCLVGLQTTVLGLFNIALLLLQFYCFICVFLIFIFTILPDISRYNYTIIVLLTCLALHILKIMTQCITSRSIVSKNDKFQSRQSVECYIPRKFLRTVHVPLSLEVKAAVSKRPAVKCQQCFK